MALVNSSFTVNVTPGAMPPIVHVSEYDIGRTYTVTINGENGSAFNIPSGTTATVEGTLNGVIGFTTDATISGSTVSFKLTESMTAKSGKAWCKIKLTLNDEPIQTCAFVLAVDRAGVEADTVIGADGFDTIIQDAVDNYLEDHPIVIDPTLTISGAAADAKVTGEKIEELKRATIQTVPITSADVYNGFVRSTTGEFVDHTGYRRTGFIPLTCAAGQSVFVKCSLVSYAGVAFYDEGKNYIIGYSWDGTRPAGGVYGLNENLELTIPDNAFYIATTLQAASYSAPTDFVIKFASSYGNAEKKMQNEIDYNYAAAKNGLMRKPVNLLVGKPWAFAGVDDYGATFPSTNRMVPAEHVDIKNASMLTATVDSGYQMFWLLYNNSKNVVIKASAYQSGVFNIPVPADAAYALFILKADDNRAASLTWVEHITVEAFYNSSEACNVLNGAAWVTGTIGEDGNDINVSNRIRTSTFLPVKGISSFDAIIEPFYEFGFTFYNFAKEKTQSFAYFSGYKNIKVPDSAYYVRFTMKYSYSDTIIPSDGERLAVTGNSSLADVVNTLETNSNGRGNFEYTGEKIVLSDRTPQINKFQLACFADYKSADVPNLASYSLCYAQSMAIFKDFIFLFAAVVGKCVVANFKTREIMTTFDLPFASNSHYNNAVFSDIYYSANDEFPLLFVSQCNNIYGPTDEDKCFIFRIQRNNNAFTCVHITDITTDFVTTSGSWCLDRNGKKITFVGYLNGNYTVSANNPTVFLSWDLPTADKLRGTETIVLAADDIVSKFEMEHVVFQGADYSHGACFFVGSPNGALYKVYGVDPSKGKITAIVPLDDEREGEGICIYNGKMYVSQIDSNDTDANNPLAIYELSF